MKKDYRVFIRRMPVPYFFPSARGNKAQGQIWGMVQEERRLERKRIEYERKNRIRIKEMYKAFHRLVSASMGAIEAAYNLNVSFNELKAVQKALRA